MRNSGREKSTSRAAAAQLLGLYGQPCIQGQSWVFVLSACMVELVCRRFLKNAEIIFWPVVNRISDPAGPRHGFIRIYYFSFLLRSSTCLCIYVRPTATVRVCLHLCFAFNLSFQDFSKDAEDGGSGSVHPPLLNQGVERCIAFIGDASRAPSICP